MVNYLSKSYESQPEKSEPEQSPDSSDRFAGRPMTRALHDEVLEILRQHSIIERIENVERSRIGRIALSVKITAIHPKTKASLPSRTLPPEVGYY